MPSDRSEPVTLMEPLLVGTSSRHYGPLADLAADLLAKAVGFRRSLPDGILQPLSDLVRSMNCYYSNLIEGHNTHPVDIERALNGDYSSNKQKRNLQLEARAHISVQRWIDAGHLEERAATASGIAEIHRRFCEQLPEELLWVEEPDSGRRQRVEPGQFRDSDVRVGLHLPVSPGAVPRFLQRFEEAYRRLGKIDAILASAAAHHRLLWIHPFLDGNGRVARLMSHAMLLRAVESGGVWSVARGLARGVGTYKRLLAEADLPRRNDLDGRGNLSEEALAAFTRFFLEACLDQVSFMEDLVAPTRLRARILLWAEEESRIADLPAKASAILEALLYRGELPRRELAELVGSTNRHARRIVAALAERHVVVSESPRAPLRLAFPASLAARWMPGLFPEAPNT